MNESAGGELGSSAHEEKPAIVPHQLMSRVLRWNVEAQAFHDEETTRESKSSRTP